jgi:sialate O-acetylesterase
MMKRFIIISIFFVTLCTSLPVLGRITLPSVFGDNMVLQQKSDVPIWGWGDPCWTLVSLEVRLASLEVRIVTSWAPDDTVKTRVNGEGKWKTSLKTPQAGGPYTLKIFTSQNDFIEYKNVMVGEVWLCSGQSNMHWWLSAFKNYEAEIAVAHHPEIRLFQVPLYSFDAPQENCDATWAACTPEEARHTSAVSYFFARRLQEALNVPVGIIISAWGGTCYEVWTEKEKIESNPLLLNVYNSVEYGTSPWPFSPGACYNGMIHPIIPYSIAGAIWYQGESNVNKYTAYGQGMQTLINNWRNRFGKEFPFYQVQIAPFNYNSGEKAALLREQQELVTRIVPKTGMVVISDLVADVNNIHPVEKLKVGERLANMALADTYGWPLKDYKSPTFKSISIENGKAVISFYDVYTGLTCSGKEIEGLKIAGADGQYVAAGGLIKGDKLIVSSPKVKAPVSVTYCFDDTTSGNLFSKGGLPVAPFRSDRTFWAKPLEYPEPFQLSGHEKKEGFKILFGETCMDEWTGNLIDYRLLDGCIDVAPTENGIGNLYTKEEYVDFAFHFKFRLTPAANNGAGIRAPMEENNAYNVNQ